MSVLVEAISVVIRRDAVERHYPGGLATLKALPPNRTLCFDDHLVRVGFMTPYDVGNYIRRLERLGFRFLVDGKARDLVVVDQRDGQTTPCDWIEVMHFDIDHDPGQRVTAAMLRGTCADPMHAPAGWTPAQSKDLARHYTPNAEFRQRMEYAGRENGLQTYRDRETGEEFYLGRTSGH